MPFYGFRDALFNLRIELILIIKCLFNCIPKWGEKCNNGTDSDISIHEGCVVNE